jgi:hypothetical protein
MNPFVLTALLLSNCLHAVEPITAFAPKERILFQGDSIAISTRGRSTDLNHILGNPKVDVMSALSPSRKENCTRRALSLLRATADEIAQETGLKGGADARTKV